MSLVTWNGKLLLSPGGKLVLGPAADECCCVEEGCCGVYPDRLKVTFEFCGTYVIYLDLVDPSPVAFPAKCWEGSLLIQDGTLTIRALCSFATEINEDDECGYWCWDACTGPDTACSWGSYGSWRRMKATSPYASYTTPAPPSACDYDCTASPTFLIEDA